MFHNAIKKAPPQKGRSETPRYHPKLRRRVQRTPLGARNGGGSGAPTPRNQGSERRLKRVAPSHPAGPGSQSVTRILWRPSRAAVVLIAFVACSITASCKNVNHQFSQDRTVVSGRFLWYNVRNDQISRGEPI